MPENFKFDELVYTRPDGDLLKKTLEKLTEDLKNAETYTRAREVFFEKEKLTADFHTMTTIASIRHTVDTKDKFYDEEDEAMNELYPTVVPYLLAFSNELYDGKFRPEFEKEFGKQLFVSIEIDRKSFTEKNIPLMQREAKLCSEYEKLIASAEISFRGEKLNLYGILKYVEDPDRDTRKEAAAAYSSFFSTNEKRMEEIWDELIHIRNEMGRNLGFENFIPLGYLQQGRTDYDAKDVAAFREQVREELVPFCETLYKAQAERLGVEKIRFYDEKCVFKSGNAVPVGDDDFLIERAREMYRDMSEETGEFIDYMLDHRLLDLKNKPGKASTGYMTELENYKAPFVFSCFNHTTFDVEVLTHELGHAFAGYMAMRTQPISAYYSETTDIAEIHSMSMEQFSYPYAEKFFGDSADKFRFSHLQEALTFVPFGVAVDEYQHLVYENEDLTPRERTALWKKLEEKYMPWRDYGDDEFFARGGWWYHKIHIFLYPFYYINYTLTTMGAMEFKKKFAEDKNAAWNDYMTLCKVGGSLGYKETLKTAHLALPFGEGSVKKACTYAESILIGSIEAMKKV